MGAPDVLYAGPGRINLKGKRVLYLANDIKTAISETDYITTNLRSVATFKLKVGVRLADLTSHPFYDYDFFDFPDSFKQTTKFKQLVEKYDFLGKLRADFSKHIDKMNSQIEYFPTQILAEFMELCNCKGIIHKSSKGPIHNYALFDLYAATCQDVELYKVKFEKGELVYYEKLE